MRHMKRCSTSVIIGEVDQNCSKVSPHISQEKTITVKAGEDVEPFFLITEFVKGRYTCFLEGETGMRNPHSHYNIQARI